MFLFKYILSGYMYTDILYIYRYVHMYSWVGQEGMTIIQVYALVVWNLKYFLTGESQD